MGSSRFSGGAKRKNLPDPLHRSAVVSDERGIQQYVQQRLLAMEAILCLIEHD
jgi:hypothetical protein